MEDDYCGGGVVVLGDDDGIEVLLLSRLMSIGF